MLSRTALRRFLKVAILAAAPLAAGVSHAQASLTLLHNNDGESKLLGSGAFGGIGYFSTILDSTRTAAEGAGRDVLLISSGDNVLAGLAFTASQRAGTYYDAIALARLEYDAITLGNHDFDFGPDVLGDFIDQYAAAGGTAPFLSANLDFSAEPNLHVQVDAGRIARSTVVTRDDQQYGIIAATTETLPTVSSPRDVVVGNVLAAIQAEVTALQALGVNKIILSSHLQGVTSELALIPQLSGIDIVIAGGGDEYLINPATGGDRYSDTLDNVNDTPDDGFSLRYGAYPLSATDSVGNPVAVVTTVGEYRYLGRLDVEFDEGGVVTSVNGNPILVDALAAGNVQDPTLVADVINPLLDAQAVLSSNLIGTTDVGLNGRRGAIVNPPTVVVSRIGTAGVRNSETNEGSLVADALLWRAVTAPDNGMTPGRRFIALTNGGGIRNDNIIPVGNLSERTTIDMLPFDNYVSVVGGVTAQGLKAMLENAVSRWAAGDGRFLQIANFRFVWDPKRQPTTFSTPANTMDDVAISGSRVRRIEFLDGTVIYDAATGAWYPDPIDVVTNSFTASGGDGFDFAGDNNNDLPGTPALPRVNLPYSYQQALFDFIREYLAGQVTALQYPAGGSGRIAIRGDADADGDIDQNDVNLIVAARNTLPSGPYDSRNLNGDAVIDALDARLATLECSRARCAVN